MVDFLRNVPTHPVLNSRYRMNLRKLASQSAGLRGEIFHACREDVLFWLNAWAVLHEPRPIQDKGNARPKVIPFIAWPHQVPVILEIKKHLGYCDIGIEKARGEGMSWIGLLLAIQQWLFDIEPVNIGLLSNTQAKSDTPGNMDSLLAKCDWELMQLPEWMAGKPEIDYVRNKSDHTLVNRRNNSQLCAFAAAAGGPRGGRYTWFLMDELSDWDRGPDEEVMKSVQQATFSRLVISTPLGSDGAYYNFMHNESDLVKLVLDWKQNPSKNRGLYRLEHGKPIAVDPETNPLFPNYNPPTEAVERRWAALRKRGFILENRLRSPWYDEQCYRPDSTPTSIAQELDRDYGGSVQRWFGETADLVLGETIETPVSRGTISVNSDLALTWDSNPNGNVVLWTPLDASRRPPRGDYTIAGDIATGQFGAYSSNSVLVVLNNLTGEQVLEYATNEVPPLQLADHAVALAKWFWGAYIAWEHMGPGVPFGRRILSEHNYTNCFLRNVLTKDGKQKSKDYGFINKGEQRQTMFTELKDFLLNRKLIVRSSAAAAEFPQYIREPGDKITHVHEKGVVDPSHGDRVIALGVGVQAMQDRISPVAKRDPKSTMLKPGEEPPEGTLAHVLWSREQRSQQDNGWDRRTSADMVHRTPSWSN